MKFMLKLLYGCLAKWSIKLGEHKIVYEPNRAIKGRALMDFLAEVTP